MCRVGGDGEEEMSFLRLLCKTILRNQEKQLILPKHMYLHRIENISLKEEAANE